MTATATTTGPAASVIPSAAQINAAVEALQGVLTGDWQASKALQDALPDEVFEAVSHEAIQAGMRVLIARGQAETREFDTGRHYRLRPEEKPDQEAEPQPAPAHKAIRPNESPLRAAMEAMLARAEYNVGHKIRRVYRAGREEEWDEEQLAAGKHVLQAVPRGRWEALRQDAERRLKARGKGWHPLAVDILAAKLWAQEQEGES